MKFLKYCYVLAIFCAINTSLFSQEVISIMYYNLLNFPNSNSARIDYLKTILDYTQPDIFVVNELSNASGASSILNNALNVNGNTHYAAAAYVDGPDDENMLYYNSTKLGLLEQNEIPTALRNINEYILYYKNPGLNASSDTAYLYVYGAHLKAGTNSSDASQRTQEAVVLKNYLANRSFSENSIVGGDFNIYGSSEGAYFQLTSSFGANLYDVIGPGEYHNNPTYTNHFTQSTRTTSFDGGSTGGMDDRFDYILFSNDLLSGQNGVRYKSGSYKAIGQDGLRWNQSLITPTNNSEPSNIVNALYFMSDHIPVYMEVEVGGTIGVNEKMLNENDQSIQVYPIPSDNYINIDAGNFVINGVEIYDIAGRKIQCEELNGLHQTQISTASFGAGVYLLKVQTDYGIFQKRILIE